MKKQNILIRHALNHPDGEKMILADGHRYRVDGYCEQTNTVYEYHGCFYHGCKVCYTEKTRVKHPRTGQSMNELYALTMRKMTSLKKLGCNYICKWDHEFHQEKISTPELGHEYHQEKNSTPELGPEYPQEKSFIP